ncbi:hypothetical protein HYPSUDRAFT_69547 [Hypholoma sublateritium FD-334 SS-4]|uniref:Uncharacterized protein n=1 Tax=Hypholoma sublateritium (strain FD-334 SS-4) TaxID=945553 RepID=A0A0D2KWS1_HYPSF|nr:hypothetical protein HYPSUDRAFT_69547 [Hypholoma sublateritium FD-334 SS-4]
MRPKTPFFANLLPLQVQPRLRPPVLALPTSLPPEDEENVNEIMRKRGMVVKFVREQVSQTDLSRLLPGQCLNDQIINFYGALLLARSEAEVSARR